MSKRRITFRRIGYRLVAAVLIILGGISVRYHMASPECHFAFYVDIPPPLETEFGDRDPSQYEFGGHIKDCVAMEVVEERKECNQQREEARGFIDEHFRGQRRGYVIFDSFPIDGISPTYLFIEPDESGQQWEIRVRSRVIGPYTRFRRNMNTTYFGEAFRRRLQGNDGNIYAGTLVLVLRSRGVYETIF